MRFGRGTFRAGWLRRSVLLALIVSFCTPLVPAVRRVVSPGPGKDLSVPFPCQHRACGCRTAAQCAKKCCCFTPSQKRVWGRQNRVNPAASQRVTEKKAFTVDASELCVAPGLDARHLFHRVAQTPSATSDSREQSSGKMRPQSDEAKSGPSIGFVVVIGWAESACQGENTLGLGFPPMIPWDASDWAPILASRSFERPVSSRVEEHRLPPPLPPPRLAVDLA